MEDNFNWDDHLDNDDDENHDENDLFGINHPLQLEKQLFFQDVQRGGPIPIDPIEFIELFGHLTSTDWNDMVDIFFSLYHRWGMDSNTLIDNWGLDWIWSIQKHCELKEEYELCSVLKMLTEEYQLKGLIKGQKIKVQA